MSYGTIVEFFIISNTVLGSWDSRKGYIGPTLVIIIFPLRHLWQNYCTLDPEYVKSAGLAGHVRRNFQMSGEGVNSRWTFFRKLSFNSLSEC